MIVLDTHAWLWWQSRPGELSRAAARVIGAADTVGVCTVSLFELVNLAETGRIRVGMPVRRWATLALSRPEVQVVDLTASIALDAAQLRFGGDPFDRIIYATARAADAQLVTRDERMLAFDPQLTVW